MGGFGVDFAVAVKVKLCVGLLYALGLLAIGRASDRRNRVFTIRAGWG